MEKISISAKQTPKFVKYTALNQIKKLAGQTVIYGISSILGRFLNYLLVPLHTRALFTEQYGVISVLYAYIAFLLVILLYGMETSFFRFYEKHTDKPKVVSTAFISILSSTLLFLLLTIVFSDNLASLISFEHNPEYIIYFVIIVGLDALSAIPFAKLRAQNKAMLFAAIKIINILINIALNLYFYFDFNTFSPIKGLGVEYVFIANLAASAVTLLLLSPQILNIRLVFDYKLWKQMLIYAFPLLFSGLAGIINEMFDRILLQYLLPEDIALSQVGIYSACYKVAILMTIFIQAFRYAAEPFFFSQAKEKNSKQTYAQVMKYFVIAGLLIFLGIMLYIDFVMLYIDKSYRSGRDVIPILLAANLFLGIYYNLSVWYKLTDNTKYGALFAILGAAITFILNFLFIPQFGYMASAWATLACYATMASLSFIIGRRFFKVNYPIKEILVYTFIAMALMLLSILFDYYNLGYTYLINSVLFLFFIYFVMKRERLFRNIRIWLIG